MSDSKTRLSGILDMLKAAFSFSLMALCVKFVSRSLPSLEVVFFRSLIGSAMIFMILRVKRIPVLGKERGLMILRGLSGFIALSLHFYTIAKLPLGLAVMLNYTGPIFAAIFAACFLKEKLRPLLAAMILVSFAGVWLLVGASFHGWDVNVLLGLLSAVFVGIVYVSIRAIKGRESTFTIIFYFTAVSTLGSCVFLLWGFKWPDAHEWLLLLGVGVGSFYGQLWMTRALRKTPASVASPFSYLTPLLSFLYGLFFFGDKLTPRAFLGAGLIILGGSLISIFEARAKVSPPTPV